MVTRAIYIAAGLGDALLTLPLAHRLRADSDRLVALVTSPMMTKPFLEHLHLFDRIDLISFSHLKKSWGWPLLPYVLRNFRRFDEIYFPPFACNRAHESLANVVAKRACYHIERSQLPVLHDAVQNIRLYDPTMGSLDLSPALMTFSKDVIERIVTGHLPDSVPVNTPYVAVQISASDSVLPQKSWPFEHWEELLRSLSERYPMHFVLMGGPREVLLLERMRNRNIARVTTVNTAGCLEEAAAVLHSADHFIGLDGGLMHLAVCLGKPTFTLWGASNPLLYGYEQMDSIRHRTLSLKLPCGPCESWLQPNQSRVRVARECPDFCCIRNLSPAIVSQEYFQFIQGLKSHGISVC